MAITAGDGNAAEARGRRLAAFSDILDQAVRGEIIPDVAGRFDAAQNFTKFAALPAEVQTIIADVAFQYGPNLAQRAPKFWSAITRGDWDAAYSELQNFGDVHVDRRGDEADLLAYAILGGDIPHP